MNYTEVTQAALNYTDRARDTEVADNLDTFLRVVESQVNNRLTIQEMSQRHTIPTTADGEYYDLPVDFKGLRDIQYIADGTTKRITLEYVNPKQSTDIKNSSLRGTQFYTIIADQLQVVPATGVGVLELVYARKVPDLTSVALTNWLSDEYPQVYIFGLCVEISAFLKAAEALDIWEQRFQAAMDKMDDDDQMSRWSGTPMQQRLG